MQKFLNTLWKFTGRKGDKDNFIQQAFKVCKVFMVKPLKTQRPDVPSKKTAYNLFCEDIRKIKKELQGVPVYKASAIISKEWKKVKSSDKKVKRYRNLYEEEKRRHAEALRRYQEDHTDEMEIINLRKRCKNKARKTSQLKKALKLSKSDEPKKVPVSPELIDDSCEEEQGPKKASRSGDGKKTATKAGKKVNKASQPKKAPKLPEFIDSSEEEEGLPQDHKEKKLPPLLGVKEEAQGLFHLRKESKNFKFEKKLEKVAFVRGSYEGYELSHLALYDTKYLKWC